MKLPAKVDAALTAVKLSDFMKSEGISPQQLVLALPIIIGATCNKEQPDAEFDEFITSFVKTIKASRQEFMQLEKLVDETMDEKETLQ